MNKQAWLAEAIEYIDSLDKNAFEEFLLSCMPQQFVLDTSYDEIKLGRLVRVSNFEAANMDTYYTDCISMAA